VESLEPGIQGEICSKLPLGVEFSVEIDSLDKLVGFAVGDFFLDVFTSLEHTFPPDDVGDSLSEGVHELSLGFAETVSVADIPGAAGGGGVDTSTATSLELHLCADGLEVGTSGDEGNLHHGSSAETSSEVGGASKDVSKMLVVHEVESCGCECLLDDGGGLGEALEDVDDVVTLLHGDDAHVVLFVEPHEEVLGLVVEDTTGVGPVATTA